MYRIALVCMALSLLTAPKTSVEELAWLAGSWEANQGGASIEEQWTEPRGGTMFGISRTVVNGKTVAFEFLRIETRGEALVYVAQPNGRSGTDFQLTEVSGQSAQFENPQHDHPKVIRYSKDADGTLRAEISGDEKGEAVSQEFLFRPATAK